MVTFYINPQLKRRLPLSNERVVPVKGIRKAIAQNMVTSVSEIPHGWMMVEADATNLVQTRNYHKAQFKRMRVTI